MKSKFFPAISAEITRTEAHAPATYNQFETTVLFLLHCDAAELIDKANRANFYGIHASTREAAAAYLAIREACRPWMDANIPSLTAYNIDRAEIVSTDARTGTHATVKLTIDHLEPLPA